MQLPSSDLDFPDIEVPQFAGLLWPNKTMNYNYTLAPTEALNNRIVELVCQTARKRTPSS